jgi:excisionase family DNA binding protein
MKRYYTPREVAEILAISDDAVLDLIETGELPAVGDSPENARVPIPAFDRWREGYQPRRRAVRHAPGRVELGSGETLPTPSVE